MLSPLEDPTRVKKERQKRKETKTRPNKSNRRLKESWVIFSTKEKKRLGFCRGLKKGEEVRRHSSKACRTPYSVGWAPPSPRLSCHFAPPSPRLNSSSFLLKTPIILMKKKNQKWRKIHQWCWNITAVIARSCLNS